MRSPRSPVTTFGTLVSRMPRTSSKQTPALSFNLNANDDVSMTFSSPRSRPGRFLGVQRGARRDLLRRRLPGDARRQQQPALRPRARRDPQGSAGTLYGRNTTGGIVHFISRKPTDEFEGYVDASSASTPCVASRRGLGPVDRVAARAPLGRLLESDGYSEARCRASRTRDRRRVCSARLQFDASPTITATCSLSAYYIDADFIPTPYEHGSVTLMPDGVTVVFLPADEPNPLCPGTPGADCLGYQDRDGDPFAQDNDREKLSDLQKFGSSITVDWELRWSDPDVDHRL